MPVRLIACAIVLFWLLGGSTVAAQTKEPGALAPVNAREFELRSALQQHQARLEAQKVFVLEDKAHLLKCEHEVLAAENHLLKATDESDRSRATTALERGRDRVVLAKEMLELGAKRLAAAEGVVAMATVRYEVFNLSSQVAKMSNGPDKQELNGRLSKLKQQLLDLEQEDTVLVQQASEAEARASELESQLEKKWKERMRGGRPVRARKLTDFVDLTAPSEAESVGD